MSKQRNWNNNLAGGGGLPVVCVQLPQDNAMRSPGQTQTRQQQQTPPWKNTRHQQQQQRQRGSSNSTLNNRSRNNDNSEVWSPGVIQQQQQQQQTVNNSSQAISTNCVADCLADGNTRLINLGSNNWVLMRHENWSNDSSTSTPAHSMSAVSSAAGGLEQQRVDAGPRHSLRAVSSTGGVTSLREKITLRVSKTMNDLRRRLFGGRQTDAADAALNDSSNISSDFGANNSIVLPPSAVPTVVKFQRILLLQPSTLAPQSTSRHSVNVTPNNKK